MDEEVRDGHPGELRIEVEREHRVAVGRGHGDVLRSDRGRRRAHRVEREAGARPEGEEVTERDHVADARREPHHGGLPGVELARLAVREIFAVAAAEPERECQRAAEREMPHDREVERDARERVHHAEARLAPEEERHRRAAVGGLERLAADRRGDALARVAEERHQPIDRENELMLLAEAVGLLRRRGAWRRREQSDRDGEERRSNCGSAGESCHATDVTPVGGEGSTG